MFVINLAYAKGGSRVEVIELSMKEGTVKARWIKSIKFGSEYEGILNSIQPIDIDHFYITVWLPEPDGIEGRAMEG